jgi:hypothetical protein
MYVDDTIKYNIAEKGLCDSLCPIFEHDFNKSQNQLSYVSDDRINCAWDIRFEFNGKAGFIIGIN